jgi:hypothetical protein
MSDPVMIVATPIATAIEQEPAGGSGRELRRMTGLYDAWYLPFTSVTRFVMYTPFKSYG